MRSNNINTELDQAVLPTKKKVSKTKLFSLSVAAFAVVATSLAPLSASAATVPNRYQCSNWTHKCVQINGAHVNGLPNACRWLWTEWYNSGMADSNCTPGYNW